MLKDFVQRINVLVETDAIVIGNNLEILQKDAPLAENRPQPRAEVIDLMTEARNHAAELKQVYDNAVFGTAHIAAGAYFAQREKVAVYGITRVI